MNGETTCKYSFMGNVCTVTSHYNIYGKLLFMISLFSQESIVGHHLLWLLWKCAFIMQLGLIIHH